MYLFFLLFSQPPLSIHPLLVHFVARINFLWTLSNNRGIGPLIQVRVDYLG